MMRHPQLRKYGNEIQKTAPRLVEQGRIPSIIIQKEEEKRFITNAKEYLEKEFGCAVEIMDAENSVHKKAQQAMPHKPAIVVE